MSWRLRAKGSGKRRGKNKFCLKLICPFSLISAAAGFPGSQNPYVFSPQEQQQYLATAAAAAAGGLLPGKFNKAVFTLYC
jgi:hypothetical protein